MILSLMPMLHYRYIAYFVLRKKVILWFRSRTHAHNQISDNVSTQIPKFKHG